MEQDEGQSTRSLQDLPPEMLLKIASFLESSEDLVSFSHACGATFRVLSQAPTVWSKLLEKLGYRCDHQTVDDPTGSRAKEDFFLQMRWDRVFQHSSFKNVTLHLHSTWNLGLKPVLHFYDDLAIGIFQTGPDEHLITLFDEAGYRSTLQIRYGCKNLEFIAASKTHAVVRAGQSPYVPELFAVNLQDSRIVWTRNSSNNFHVGNNKVYLFEGWNILVLSLETGDLLHTGESSPYPVYNYEDLEISHHKVGDHLKWIPFWIQAGWESDSNYRLNLLNTDSHEIVKLEREDPFPDPHFIIDYFLIDPNVPCRGVWSTIVDQLPDCPPIMCTNRAVCRHVQNRLCSAVIHCNRQVPDFCQLFQLFQGTFLLSCVGLNAMPPGRVLQAFNGDVMVTAFFDPSLVLVLRRLRRKPHPTQILKFEEHQGSSIIAMRLAGFTLLLLLKNVQREPVFIMIVLNRGEVEDICGCPEPNCVKSKN